MASNATIFKAAIHIANMDREYYQKHALTLARHPSETDERMMVRLLAFALHAHEALSFGRGVSAEEEPTLWLKDLTGAVDLWIEVGQPDEKIIRRACGRAKQVCIYTYGGHGPNQWWEKNMAAFAGLNNLIVINLPLDGSRALATLAQPRSLSDIAFVKRGEGGAARCEAAGPEKPEAYSLEYVEDFSRPSTTQMVTDRSPQ